MTVWTMWAGILIALRFLRIPPIYDEQRLDSKRVVLAAVALLVMILSFMPVPLWQSPSSH
jgi:hypothetical protein